MDATLIASAALLGLAGTPHCAAMCAGPCVAAVGAGGRSAAWAFQVGRLASYAAVGAVVAGSVGALAGLAAWSPALRPLWALVQGAVLVLGLWMLWQGRQPAWMGGLGRVPAAASTAAEPGWVPVQGPVALASVSAGAAPSAAWAGSGGAPSGSGTPARRAAPAWGRALMAGALWAAWPCGLLQSALLVAGLTGGPLSGALAMSAFALASAGGLVWAPWLMRRVGGREGRLERGLIRASGAVLAAGALFALGGGIWHQVAAYCGLA